MPNGNRRPSFPLGRLSFLLGENSEVLRLYVFVGDRKTLGGQSAFDYFANGGRSAWHTPREAPIVNGRQLIFRQHDLQTFNPTQCHGKPPCL